MSAANQVIWSLGSDPHDRLRTNRAVSCFSDVENVSVT